jgi:cell division FtsZ-interacting protein ZapD
MLQQLLSITQTAERLRVRPEYVRELDKKQRLTFIHGEQLDAAQVEKLAKLMDKLRNNGIATLVQIVEDGGKPQA